MARYVKGYKVQKPIDPEKIEVQHVVAKSPVVEIINTDQQTILSSINKERQANLNDALATYNRSNLEQKVLLRRGKSEEIYLKGLRSYFAQITEQDIILKVKIDNFWNVNTKDGKKYKI